MNIHRKINRSLTNVCHSERERMIHNRYTIFHTLSRYDFMGIDAVGEIDNGSFRLVHDPRYIRDEKIIWIWLL